MNQILIDTPMPILTPRLRIQPRQVGEGKILCEVINSSLAHLGQYLPFATEPQTEAKMEESCVRAIEEFNARSCFILSVYDRFGESLIGSATIHGPNWKVPSFKIGYWIAKEFVGRGFATEVANALTRYAFQILKARRVQIDCDSRNLASLNVALKLGFVQEGMLKNHDVDIQTGVLCDSVITARYNLLNLPPLEVSW